MAMPSKALCQSAQWPPRKSAPEATNAPVNGVHPPESLRYERLLDEADFLLELQAETPNDAQTDLLKENYALLRDAFREVKDAALVNQIKDRMKRVTSLLMKMSDLKSKSNSSSSVSDIPVNGNHSTERYRPSIATNKPSDLNLSVHSLKSRDGAILDLDDILSHADDREQLIASLLDEFPDGGRYAKSSLSHSYSHKGGQPTSPGIYGEANNHAPTHLANNSSSETSNRSTLNRNYRRSGDPLSTANGSAHSMSHYGQLGVRAEPIYGRTSTEQYQYAFHLQQRQHQRNSVTDSLLSSNESPDPVLLSDQHLGEGNYGERRNGDAGHHQRSGSYSSAQVNGYKSGPSFHLPPPPPHCRNGASVTPAIAIAGSGGNNSRQSNFPISRSYDPKYGPRLHDEPDFSESADVVEITEENISLYATTTANRSSHVPTLHVRHGSDPALDAVRQGNSREHPANGFAKSLHLNDPSSKRWSTAIAVDHSLPSRQLHPPASSLDANYEHSDEEKSFNSVSPQSTKEEGYASEERPNSQAAPTPTLPTSPLFQATSPPFGKFTRGSGRLSMLANNFDVWADAADRQLLRRSERNIASKDPAFSPKRGQQQPEQIIQKMRQQQRQHQPIQPYDSSLGSMTSASSQENEHHLPRIAVTHDGDASQPTGVAISVIIDMAKELGPLGIHVLPDADTGTILTRGLLIQGIEPGGRIDRDGRLHVGDIIVAIDDHHFVGLEFTQAQDIFRRSLQNESIRLGIVKTSNDDICDSPLYSNANDQRQPPPCSAAEERNADSELGLVEGETRAGQQTKLATVTSTRKHSIDSLPIPSKQHSSAIVVANTRRIGKKYHIQLKKGLQGLGFTITTRDNPAGGLSPIYIKTILPRGAAVQDGRLKPGDRLLEVCGIEMTGKTQEEAVRILRNLSKDSIVDLIVSRQEMEMSPSPLLPRQLPPEKVNEPECSSSNEREVLVFQIQPLNDTTSSGLGLSVKGKTSNSDGKHVDLGIFVKAVLAGGAAWKDGRLRTDDQLLSINEIPLSGKTNGEAMETLRRAMIIKPKSKNEKDCTADEQKDNVITLVVARRVCNSPSHCTESTSEETLVTYRHQHEASILSSDSFDLSFNADSSVTKGHPATSPLNASHESSCQEDDSYRSSENTVIFCAPSMGPVSTSPTKNGIYDSELSLNDDSGASERFKRDGFGRQSMSEKRHAQLDAKSTDTYRRNKKSREEKLNLATDEDQMATSPSPSSQVSNSRVNNSQMNALSYGEDEHSDRLEAIRRMNSASIKENLPLASNSSSSITPPKPSKSPTKNQMFLFSPCCIKCQSPGSCPHHSKSDIEPNGRTRAGLYVKNTNATEMSLTNTKETVGSPFGLRRSCSLESLQMMMQDLQKEQLEKVGGNIPGFVGARHGTVRVARSRETNESFRVAVDRSYEIKNYINRVNMDKVEEEQFESNHDSSPSTCPFRVGGGHSMTSTNFTSGTALTTTTNDDDNANLLKPKKKKGLFKNLFHFGSKKGRSKSASAEPSDRYSHHHRHHDDSHTSDEAFRSPDLNRNRQYQAEQEKINAHYRKLMEQARHQQQQQSQPPQFVRNQLHPLHKSMPAGQRSKSSPNAKMDANLVGSPPMNGNGAFHPGFHASPQHYGRTLVNRDTIGVPHKGEHSSKINAYLRQQHRVHPEMKMTEGSPYGDSSTQIRQTDGPRHLRGNSHDFYNRTPVDRPGSRVAISESSNYATQGVFSTYGNNSLSPNGIPPSGHLVQHRPDAASGESAHYRQLSLRNPAHHHRQISTPATSQNYYGTGQRPVSSYYEYENAAHPKNGADNANMVNFRKALMNQQHQQQQQQQSGYGQVNYRNHNNNETLYGIVGQQVNKRPSLGPPGQAGTLSAQQQQQQQNILRQQQPIYQSNQVQIYGSSVYNTLPNQQQPIYGRLPPQGNRSGGLYGSFPRNDIYATNGLPNAYQTKG